MKRVLLSTFVAATLLLAWACSDDKDPAPGNTTVSFGSGAGKYFGDRYETGTGNFTVNLTSGDAELDIELFSNLAADPENATIAAGTYNIGTVADGNPGTFVAGGSGQNGTIWRTKQNGAVTSTSNITAGTITVERSSSTYTVALNLQDASGNNFLGTFSGQIAFENKSGGTEVISKNPSGSFAGFSGIYYGDRYETESTNLVLTFHKTQAGTADKSEYFVLECFNEFYYGDKIQVQPGDYRADRYYTQNGRPGTYGPGSMENGEVAGSYYYYAEDDETRTILLTEGEFTIAFAGDYYILTTNFTGLDISTDAEGVLIENIEFTYSGTMDDFEIEGPTANRNITSFEKAKVTYRGNNIRPDAGNYEIRFWTEFTDGLDSKEVGMVIELTGDVYEDPENPPASFLSEGWFRPVEGYLPNTIIAGKLSGSTPVGCYYYKTDAAGNLTSSDYAFVSGGYMTIEDDFSGYAIKMDFQYENSNGTRVSLDRFTFTGFPDYEYIAPEPQEYEFEVGGEFNLNIMDIWYLGSIQPGVKALQFNIKDTDRLNQLVVTAYIAAPEAGQTADPTGRFEIQTIPAGEFPIGAIVPGQISWGDPDKTFFQRWFSNPDLQTVEILIDEGWMEIEYLREEEYFDENDGSTKIRSVYNVSLELEGENSINELRESVKVNYTGTLLIR